MFYLLSFFWKTCTRHCVFVKIYILYSCKKIHIERNHHTFKSRSPLWTTSLLFLHWHCLDMQKKRKIWKTILTKIFIDELSKRLIKTLIYNIKRSILHWFQWMHVTKDKKTKNPALYENIPQVPTLFSIYRQQLQLSSTASTIYN